MKLIEIATASSGSAHTKKRIAQTGWELWQGSLAWFIIGPGDDAWLQVSESDYINRRPYLHPSRRTVLQAAVAHLNATAFGSDTAGKAEIRAAISHVSTTPKKRRRA